MVLIGICNKYHSKVIPLSFLHKVLQKCCRDKINNENTSAVLAFFDQQKGSITSNKINLLNCWATYTFNKE